MTKLQYETGFDPTTGLITLYAPAPNDPNEGCFVFYLTEDQACDLMEKLHQSLLDAESNQ